MDGVHVETSTHVLRYLNWQPVTQMSYRPKSTTSRPSPWPTHSACARSRLTATVASVPCTPQAGRREQARVALAAAINLYRSMEMTFWLPQVEATLTQVG
jgi:hypothetical protein